MTRSSRAALVAALAVCAALFALPASALAFGPLSSFGSFGEGAGQINEVGGVAVAADGSSYVVDYDNNRIDVFSSGGGFLFAFGKEVNVQDGSDVCTSASGCQAGEIGGPAGAMNQPEGIAIAPGGNVYVADEHNNRIDVFSAQGAFLFAFGKNVNPGPGDSGVCTPATTCQSGLGAESAGAMSNPTGIGLSGSGDVYVADSENNRIDVFSAQGIFLFAFGKEVDFEYGTDICTFVTECEAGLGSGEAGAMIEPADAKVTPGGLVAVADEGNDRIDIFTSVGVFVRAFGKAVNAEDGSDVCTAASGCEGGIETPAAGGFVAASAAAVDGSGALYVADSELNRISQFTLDGGFVRAFGEGVIDGAEAFQVCTAASGCQQGGKGTIAGAIPSPYGVAVDGQGRVYVAEESPDFARVEVFGDPVVPAAAPPAVAPIIAAAKPSNKIKFGKLTLNKKKGTATLVVKVPGPGSLVLKGKGLKKVKRVAKKASSVKFPVALAGKAKKKLNKAGKAKVKAKLTFSPTGGTPLVTPKSLTLKKTLAG
jgi:DNA-binding beta-propeller fold protein YncE